jgi:branched-chain amino acid transport system substrate-binding protein
VNKKVLFGLAALTLLILVALPLFGACTQPATPPATTPSTQPTAEVKKLTIGSLMSLTGWFVVNDIPGWQAIQVAADMINDRGGIDVNGTKYMIDPIVEDCKSTMDGVTAAATRLVHDKGVKFIVGPSAFFSPAAAPVTDPAGVIRVSTWCCNTPGECDATTPYSFVVDGNVLYNMAAMKYMKQAYPNVKKIVYIIPDDGTEPFVTPIVTKLLEKEGFSIVGDPVMYPNELQDFSPIVTKINGVKEADAIYQVIGITPHVAAIAKGLYESGNKKPYVTGLPTPLAEVVAVAGPQASEGVSNVSVIGGDPGNTALLNEIFDRERAKYDQDYVIQVAGANSLWALKCAIEAAKSIDPVKVKEAWEKMDKLETVYGMGIVGGEQTYGIRHVVSHPLSISVVKGGKVVSGGWIDSGAIP